MILRSLIVTTLLLAPAATRAQHGGAAPPSRTPPAEASQFNFLIGQWELEVIPAPTSLGQRIHGTPKLVGTWKAWRALDGWGIEDELRISDASGNPINLTHAMRFYSREKTAWQSSTLDVYRGVFGSNASRWSNGQMTVNSSGTDQDGKAYLSRGRYSDITRDSFRLVQERSTDNGKTWKLNLTIEAKRVADRAAR